MLSKHASVIQTAIAVLFAAGLNQPVEVQALDKDDGNRYPIETAAHPRTL